jgi:phosphoesterase RecJ-like protein
MNDHGRIVEAIGRGRRFLVTSHINPDGDAIGSELALVHLLRSLGKTVNVVNHDPVPQNLRFLPGAELISAPGRHSPPYDATFLVDCGQFNRAGDAVPPDRNGLGTIINIDHHATSVSWADLNWIDPLASSTCEIIHRLITAVRGEPDLDMACCVYTGIMTDTGSFRYNNTSSRVLALAAELVDRGVDPAQIATHVYDSVPFPSLKLLGRALANLATTPDGLVAWMSLEQSDLAATGTTWEATEEFVNFPRSITSAVVALFFKAISATEVKVSLRSRGRVDVSGYALSHQGGGHRNAAGFVAQGSLDEVVSLVVADISRELRSLNEPPSREHLEP